MVLQFLAALVGLVFVAHGNGPDTPGYPSHDRIFGVHAIREEEGQIVSEVIYLHSAGDVGFDKGETIGEGEGQLGDGIGAGFGNVIARDGD